MQIIFKKRWYIYKARQENSAENTSEMINIRECDYWTIITVVPYNTVDRSWSNGPSITVSITVAAASPSSPDAPFESRVSSSRHPSSPSGSSHPVRHGLPGVHQDVNQLWDHSGVSSHVHEAGSSASVANSSSTTNSGRKVSEVNMNYQVTFTNLWTYSSTSFGISKLMTCRMSLMSSPLAATDVATRMGCFPG